MKYAECNKGRFVAGVIDSTATEYSRSHAMPPYVGAAEIGRQAQRIAGKSIWWTNNRDRMGRARAAYRRLKAGALAPSAAEGVQRDYAVEFAMIEKEGKE